ncbi:alanine dehydrogenase [Desulfitispora alkaliphila]|uniref:alanine dehydrogenase n=1 Tax=Desulfitispora alkaliphila TaxID=622674 RepID=UPI003D1AF7E2
MIVGVPKELKDNENRVAITPAGVKALTSRKHQVIIENNAGLGSGIKDTEYLEVGAKIVSNIKEVYGAADLIAKVKEPQPSEFDLLKSGQVLFTYLHAAAEPLMVSALLDKEVIGISYDTVQLENGFLPLLAPMSEIAGRMSIQVGAQFLEKHHGGRGLLLGGVPGVASAKVVIIGGGTVGANAAKIAVGMGAQVTIIDLSATRMRELENIFGSRVQTIMSNEFNIFKELKEADLVIGAVLIPGAKAPKVVTEKMVKEMKEGSVIVDVAIDQGGCVETMDTVTKHSDPVYIKHGVVHYAVANMPGAVARTSTFALTNATLPYLLKLADMGCEKALRDDVALANGLNVYKGKVTNRVVAQGLGYQ